MHTKSKNRQTYGPMQISNLLGNVTKTAFKRRGFAEGKLISDWSLIVGKELAKQCHPIRMSFAQGKREGGTLHINIYGSLATALQHMEPLIIEKISTYFGYKAVNKIKLIHGKIKPAEEKDCNKPETDFQISPQEQETINHRLDDIDDIKLKAALAGLGKSMLAKEKNKSGE